MTWTAPITAVDGDILTADTYNSNVRDNLLETMPGKAVYSGDWFTSSGVNSISRRSSTTATQGAEVTTTSTSYVALTNGPSAATVTGYDALVLFSCTVANDTAGQIAYASFSVLSPTNLAASDEWAVMTTSTVAGAANTRRWFGYYFFEGTDGHVLTPGYNIFQMQFKVSGGTGRFADRSITVIPF